MAHDSSVTTLHRKDASPTTTDGPLLDVHNLSTYFYTPGGVLRAVDDVSFSIAQNETVGLVGESGCGKSVTALSILRLVPSPPGKIVGGQVLFQGRDLLAISAEEMRKVRGAQIGVIFQEPMTSLNPVLSIGKQLTERIERFMRLGRRAARDRAAELLSLVGIPDARARLNEYPHQMSGGQRQRIMIAIALSCDPKLIIADEATTALDVTIQAQILELLATLREQFSAALVIITHNLGIVARYADRVTVMYAGKIRESGTAIEIYGHPAHPYTTGLLRCVPRADTPRQGRLDSIEGEIPNLLDLPGGCAFHPRCRWRTDPCIAEEPPLAPLGTSHTVACWNAETVMRGARETQA